MTTSITRSFAIGTPEFRILEIGTATAAPTVTISHILFGNGRVSGSIGLGGVPLAGVGGCIYFHNGSLTIADSEFEDCVALGFQSTGNPADARGGAVAAIAGTLVVRDSSFSLNAVTGGEALSSGFSGGAAEGGAIYASGLTSFVVRSTTFDSNFATGGAGVSSGGVAKGGGVVFYGLGGLITGSTFSANAASGGVASSGTSGISIGGAIVVEGATLTLTDSDLTNNVVSGQNSPSGVGGYAFGGAVYSSSSTLTVGDSDISSNRATGGQGPTTASDGTARAGGLYLVDTTGTLDDVRIEENTISGSNPRGGGISVFHQGLVAAPLLIVHSSLAYNNASATTGTANGGALYQEGDTVTIRNTTISDNNADLGSGVFQDNGTTLVALSSFLNNRAHTHGGAVAVDSPGFLSHTVELTNVTISGNTADVDGGGLYITGAPLAPSVTTVSLNNTTVTNNAGGGVYLVHGHTDPILVSGNTIIGAQASGADCAVSGTATLTSNGGNLESGTSCAFTAASDQQSVADLGLSPLGNYGGETLTHDLLPTSPAIDAGRRRACRREAHGRDQRGLARFYDGNGDRAFDCDSGAVEFQGLLANPGFEDPLNAGTDWSLVASGGGDGRLRTTTAPSGKFVVVLQANGALETLSQKVQAAGGSGETYALTLLALGAGLTAGQGLDVTLETMAGGTSVDTRTCTFAFPSAAFSGSPPACELTTTAAHDFSQRDRRLGRCDHRLAHTGCDLADSEIAPLVKTPPSRPRPGSPHRSSGHRAWSCAGWNARPSSEPSRGCRRW